MLHKQNQLRLQLRNLFKVEGPAFNFNAKSLYAHEWVIVALFVGALFLLSSFSFISRSSSNVDPFSHWTSDPLIIIDLKGEVSSPGRYIYSSGVTVKKIISDAGKTPQTDLKGLSLEEPITESRVLKIHKLKKKDIR
jgi:hypothetical protein